MNRSGFATSVQPDPARPAFVIMADSIKDLRTAFRQIAGFGAKLDLSLVWRVSLRGIELVGIPPMPTPQ